FPSVEFEPKGGIVVTTTEAGAQPLIDFAGEQKASLIDARVLNLSEALEREPHLNPEITAAVYYPEDCQIQPTIATEALLADARKNGARFFTKPDVLHCFEILWVQYRVCTPIAARLKQRMSWLQQ